MYDTVRAKLYIGFVRLLVVRMSIAEIVLRVDFNALAAIFTRGTKLGDRAKDPLSWTSRSVILTRVASELKLPNGWYRA